ncbi:MAG: hypothetical protein V7638_1487 [Acidobacteriota bacterium]|jgi:hypothetical protein
MFPNFNFIDCVVMFLGVLSCFKRVAEMERHHHLRVIILTSILGVIVILFVIGLGSAFDRQIDCPPEHFCQIEM